MTQKEHHPPPHAGRPRSTEADAAILEAAADLLLEEGLDGVSVDRVARRAGVSRPTIYRRYPGKTELLIAAIHWVYRYQPEQELPAPRDLEELLRWWALALEGPENAGIRTLTLRLLGVGHDHPEFAAAFRAVSVEPRNAMVREVLLRERDRGRFPEDTDLEVVRKLLAGAVLMHLTTNPHGSTVEEAERFFLAVLRETRFQPLGVDH
ncbi:TetR/AcrR family transcriptional regulator [Spiractinospora alimapuensis]|uniref:TetR/AcrR family transcriptional regulator n=1 Tax=Spiractinospora alimapuensis TaxID=2820884 RepID=UPI001F39E5BE|nr:TetR/AcrR family transcriptional regulator [Spiractinospora alimapuensis]QVQ52208.1 TetR/AcrR family transcriptional regulator [Spiractinospora alimapuensis]